MEQLLSSHYIVNIYGYCGQSQLVEYGGGGSLHDHVKRARIMGQDTVSSKEKLQIFYQISKAVADAHDSGIAHTDIHGSQFILCDVIYKLNDFDPNFLKWHKTDNTTCLHHWDGYWSVSCIAMSWLWRSSSQLMYYRSRSFVHQRNKCLHLENVSTTGLY